MQDATYIVQHATESKQHAALACNMQQAACNMQHASGRCCISSSCRAQAVERRVLYRTRVGKAAHAGHIFAAFRAGTQAPQGGNASACMHACMPRIVITMTLRVIRACKTGVPGCIGRLARMRGRTGATSRPATAAVAHCTLHVAKADRLPAPCLQAAHCLLHIITRCPLHVVLCRLHVACGDRSLPVGDAPADVTSTGKGTDSQDKGY
jgi:hypothetical protein